MRFKAMPKTKTKRKGVGTRRNGAAQVSKESESSEVDQPTGHSPADRLTSPVLSQTARSLASSVDGDMEAGKLALEFRTVCSRHANASHAAAMRQYMRNQFTFFGIKTPERRQLQKKFTSDNREKLSQRAFLLRFAVALWRQEERECQLYGVDLMAEFRKQALGETEADFGEAVACVEVLIGTKSWWDTVDMLASQMVGYMVSQRRESGVALMEEWIAHPCMWFRRTALLHQLNYKAGTDQALLFKLCLTVAHEEEFFIRKAIGWALRQYGRTDADAVRQFVEKNRASLSKLSTREAMKHL